MKFEKFGEKKIDEIIFWYMLCAKLLVPLFDSFGLLVENLALKATHEIANELLGFELANGAKPS